jgi:hypothetical protein
MLGEPYGTPCLVSGHTPTSTDHVSPDEGIDVESGSGPVHAPFPKQRAAKPGGQTAVLRL